jgi:NADH-quinone oxidoreductase subunit M
MASRCSFCRPRPCSSAARGRRLADSRRAAPLSPGLYFALLLLLEAATLGVFCALDTILFFFCWEFTLLPLYFLVSLWGVGAGRQAAAVRYFLVMLAGGVPLLFGLLALAFGHAGGGRWCSTCRRCWRRRCRSHAVRRLPAAARRLWRQGATGAPAHLAAVDGHGRAGGGHGAARRPQARRLRADPPGHPAGADRRPRPALAARRLRHLAILYGGVAALAHSNLRGVLAYSSLAHVGLVVLGLASSRFRRCRARCCSCSTSASPPAAAFWCFPSCSAAPARPTSPARRRDAQHAACCGFFLLFGLAGIGLPGTSGFPGELLIIVAALHSHTGAGLAALFGMVLAAAGFLSPFRQAFLGPLRNAPIAAAADLLPRELGGALAAAAGAADPGRRRLSAADPRTRCGRPPRPGWRRWRGLRPFFESLGQHDVQLL